MAAALACLAPSCGSCASPALPQGQFTPRVCTENRIQAAAGHSQCSHHLRHRGAAEGRVFFILTVTDTEGQVLESCSCQQHTPHLRSTHPANRSTRGGEAHGQAGAPPAVGEAHTTQRLCPHTVAGVHSGQRLQRGVDARALVVGDHTWSSPASSVTATMGWPKGHAPRCFAPRRCPGPGPNSPVRLRVRFACGRAGADGHLLTSRLQRARHAWQTYVCTMPLHPTLAHLPCSQSAPDEHGRGASMVRHTENAHAVAWSVPQPPGIDRRGHEHGQPRPQGHASKGRSQRSSCHAQPGSNWCAGRLQRRAKGHPSGSRSSGRLHGGAGRQQEGPHPGSSLGQHDDAWRKGGQRKECVGKKSGGGCDGGSGDRRGWAGKDALSCLGLWRCRPYRLCRPLAVCWALDAAACAGRSTQPLLAPAAPPCAPTSLGRAARLWLRDGCGPWWSLATSAGLVLLGLLLCRLLAGFFRVDRPSALCHSSARAAACAGPPGRECARLGLQQVGLWDFTSPLHFTAALCYTHVHR